VTALPESEAMRAIPFTQYMMPDGRRVPQWCDVEPEVAAKAGKIIARGFVFECEVLRTGDVSLTITDPGEGDLDIRVVPNGPAVPDAVKSLVMEFPL
jgi:hypothetical protein